MKEAEPVTLVNVFEIARGDLEEFKAEWEQRASHMSSQPGFISTQLLEALSEEWRFQLINVARWENEEAWRRANEDPAMKAARQRVTDGGSLQVRPNVGLYRPAVTIDGADVPNS